MKQKTPILDVDDTIESASRPSITQKASNLLVFDNPYHKAIMSQNNDKESKSPSTISLSTNGSSSNGSNTAPGKIAAIALDQVQSVMNLVEKSINQKTNTSLELTLKDEATPTTTPKTPTKAEAKFDFLNPGIAKLKAKRAESKPDIRNTENELNSIIKHLQETELELKKEQKEKNLLEIKFKQQQQEHNKQVNGLIEKYE